MRIEHASSLRRGLVLTLHHPQTHPNAPRGSKPFEVHGAVVVAVLADRFVAVVQTDCVACSKYHERDYYFGDFQIRSETVPEVREDACNWVELTGSVDEEEVKRMLSDRTHKET